MSSDDLERWEREVGGGALTDDLVAQVRSHPRFGEALKNSVDRAIAHVAADPLLHRNFRDLGHVMLASLALHLDATGGLTHRRLRELSAGSGALSSGRATALLLHLQVIGYVNAAPDHRNGSTRLYVPTGRMKDAYRRRLLIDLESIAMIEPELCRLTANFDDAAFRAYMAAMGEFLRTLGPRYHPDLKEFDALANRHSGVLAIYMLVQAAWRSGPFPQPGEARISASAMATRLDVSRMHVQRLLRAAEAAGFIRRTGSESVMVTQLLCDRLSLWTVLLFTLNGAIAWRALKRLRGRNETQEISGAYAESRAVQ